MTAWPARDRKGTSNMGRVLLRGVVLAVFLPVFATAGTIYVNGTTGNDAWDGLCEVWDGGTCGPKLTIRAAIDAANWGTVIVADGTYTGLGNRDIRFFGKAITVRSVSGPAGCIIDCEELGQGFFLCDNETNASVIDGFTIRRAYWQGGGGGIACYSSPIIRNCVLSENTALTGGGAFLTGDSLLVEHCTFVSNVATESGGGIYARGTGVTIRDCVIASNTATGTYDYGHGGGLYVEDGATTVERCVFSNNSADWGGGLAARSGHVVNCTITSNHALYGGGALYTDRDDGLILANCVVAGNSSYWYGGGVYADGAEFQFYGCTVTGNAAGWYGGGLYCFYGSTSELHNSIVAGNTATYGAEVALDDWSQLVTEYSDILGGDDWLWVGGGSFVVWGNGNIDLDPAFIDPDTGNYRLQQDSPCVDAGSNEALPSDWADLDGDGDLSEPVPYDLDDHPRVARFTVDMGAYEVPFGDLNCDGSVGFGDINPFVLVLSNPSAWQAAYPGCELLYGDINGDGSVNFGDINPFVALLTGR